MWPAPSPQQQQSYYPNVSQPAAQTQQAPASASQVTQIASGEQPVNATTSAPLEPAYCLETLAKNYVVHELAQQKGTAKPTWAETMQSMFGDHVKWDEIKVFVGKGRPLCKYNKSLLAFLH
jgi:vacuolar protein sorting-associated protein 72